MQRRGYLIRFIDIGLIILFGFLMISDLTIISQIQLPGKDLSAPPPEEAVEQRWYHIRVSEAGIFSILEDGAEEPAYVNIEETEVLESILLQVKDETGAGSRLNLVIEPSPRVHMQQLVDVLDLCERLGVPHRINSQFILSSDA